MICTQDVETGHTCAPIVTHKHLVIVVMYLHSHYVVTYYLFGMFSICIWFDVFSLWAKIFMKILVICNNGPSKSAL